MNLPKILFFHANHTDYLAEPLFHGLRTLLGTRCLDVPRMDSIYAPRLSGWDRRLRGGGFTLYHLLEDQPEAAPYRHMWMWETEEVDLIVVAQAWLQGDLLLDLNQAGLARKTVVLDGHDSPHLYPWARRWLKSRPWHLLNHGKNLTFKREWMADARDYGLEFLLPRPLWGLVPPPAWVRPIAFSIPAEKISRIDPGAKTKLFPAHIVDEEVAKAHGATTSYAFTREEDYRRDLQASKFGVTTRRAGWDCLRHYELAANGCVLCFRDLHLKPTTCAPHGLVPGENCIAYRSAADLATQIGALDDAGYRRLLDATYRWIGNQTTVARAREFLRAALPGFDLGSLGEAGAGP